MGFRQTLNLRALGHWVSGVFFLFAGLEFRVGVLGSIRETLKGTPSYTYGSLKGDLIERVHITKGPPNP